MTIVLEQKRVALGNGIELDVVDMGPKDAPVLIFLHGFPENHRSWRHQIAHFAKHFRCIAPDQRGYRGSSKPQEVDAYTPDKLVGDVFAMADALGVDTFTIVGHDWGGAIAWGVAYWGQTTGRVTRAVIANAPHLKLFQKLLYTNKVQREASQYMREFRDPANDALVREHGLGGLLFKAIKWGEDRSPMDEHERAILMADWLDRDAAFGMLNYYRASPIDIPPLDAPYALPEGYAVPPMPKLAIPTLVVWAMDDLALPPENLEGIEDEIEDLTLVKVPGCGHFVQWEEPEAVTAAMDEFLRRTA